MSGNKEQLSGVPAELHEFFQETDNTISSWNDLVSASAVPELIYHYTDQNGLRSILESGKIWLTDIFSLNDPSELLHGFSHFLDALAVSCGEDFPPGLQLVKDMEEYFKRGGVKKSADYFICSFSTAGDDLGQWRSYADDARGYTLGFDCSQLEQAFARDCVRNSAFPINYDETLALGLHKRIALDSLKALKIPQYKKWDKEKLKEFVVALQTISTMRAIQIAIHFKHKAYKNEQEYRFLQLHISAPESGTSRRVRRDQLVRYREFDWRKNAPNALKIIGVGPSANSISGPQFAYDCLDAYHSGDVAVEQSKIPYRAV